MGNPIKRRKLRRQELLNSLNTVTEVKQEVKLKNALIDLKQEEVQQVEKEVIIETKEEEVISLLEEENKEQLEKPTKKKKSLQNN